MEDVRQKLTDVGTAVRYNFADMVSGSVGSEPHFCMVGVAQKRSDGRTPQYTVGVAQLGERRVVAPEVSRVQSPSLTPFYERMQYEKNSDFTDNCNIAVCFRL